MIKYRDQHRPLQDLYKEFQGRAPHVVEIEHSECKRNPDANDPRLMVSQESSAIAWVHRGIFIKWSGVGKMLVAVGFTRGNREYKEIWPEWELVYKFLLLDRNAPIPAGLQQGHGVIRIDNYYHGDEDGDRYTVIDVRNVIEASSTGRPIPGTVDKGNRSTILAA